MKNVNIFEVMEMGYDVIVERKIKQIWKETEIHGDSRAMLLISCLSYRFTINYCLSIKVAGKWNA